MYKTYRKSIPKIAIGITALAFFLLANGANASTLTVDDSGGGDYARIQDAIDNASSGDVIFVYSGTYNEQVKVNKQLILHGIDTDSGMPVVDASESGNVIEVTAERVSIDRFMIQNGTTGIFITSNNNVISNNVIKDNLGKNGLDENSGGIASGIYLLSSIGNTIINNNIIDMTGGTGGKGGGWSSGGSGGIASGIYLSGSPNNTITANTFSNITGGKGGTGGYYGSGGSGGIASGIYISGSANNTLTNNAIINMTGGIGGIGGQSGYYGQGSGGSGGIASGIYLSSSYDNTFSNNIISDLIGGTSGIGQFRYSAGAGGVASGIYIFESTNNNFLSNTIYNTTGGTGGNAGWSPNSGGSGGLSSGIYISSSTNNTFSINTIYNLNAGEGGEGSSFEGRGGSNGVKQGGYGIYLASNSYQNTIDKTNIVDGDPIVYLYSVDNEVIENLILTANSNPTNLGKIVLIYSKNTVIKNNTISNMKGGSISEFDIASGIYLYDSANDTIIGNTIHNMSGGAGYHGYYKGSGAIGGISSGLYLYVSTNNTLIGNTISSIMGGPGGDAGSFDYGSSGSGGSGGIASGILIFKSTNDTIIENTISDITGGTGGNGATPFSGSEGSSSGGSGGIASGMNLLNSVGTTLASNNFSNIIGGEGGTGGEKAQGGKGGISSGFYVVDSVNDNFLGNNIINIIGGKGGNGDFRGSGGAGGITSGIYILSSTNNTVVSNIIRNITGAIGGTGGYEGSGGSGSTSSGIYLSDSNNNTLTNNTISSMNGGNGGISGISVGQGGSGGIASGIYIHVSVDNIITKNSILNIIGGTGGNGNLEYFGSGGTGGLASGIYLSDSIDNTIIDNYILNMIGGIGGTGSSRHSGGSGGIASGIYLTSSNYNTLKNNTFCNMIGGFGGNGGSYGGSPGSKGANQVGYGVYIEYDSYQNKIDLTNTVNGDPIVYLYNADGIVIENYILINNSNPTNLGKIVLINSKNIDIIDNNIGNITGSVGDTGGTYLSGNSGGIVFGIYLHNSTNITLIDNIISNIAGGKGGTGGVPGSGRNGGMSVGIYLFNSNNNIFNRNIIIDLNGGEGGTGGFYGSGGTGGNASGIYLSVSTNNTLINNNISNMTGGIGGSRGSNGPSTGANVVDHNIYLDNSNINKIYNNNFISNSLQQVYVSGGSDNIFNLTIPIGGNYWNNWNSPDNNNDGFVDTPYIFTGGQDNLPWASPDGWLNIPPAGNTPTGSSIQVNPNPNVSVNYSEVTGAGDTTVTISTTNPRSEKTGFKFLGTYYNISTTAVYNAPVTIYISYDDSDIPGNSEHALKIFHWNGIDWVDVTSSLDTLNNIICATVSSFSWFAAAYDNLAPTTIISLSGTSGNNDWYVFNVEVALASSDNEGGSGLASTEYSFDNAIWIIYNEKFAITNEGTTTLYYRSTDNVGNIESTKNQKISIDKSPPTITGASTTYPNDKGWYNADVAVHFTATDKVSGIDTVTPDQTLSYEGSSQSVKGTDTDKAGNSASKAISGINIDKTPPQIIINTPVEGSEYILNKTVLANWSVNDSLSGVASVEGTASNEAAFDTATVGNKTFNVVAVDNAGNIMTKAIMYYVRYNYFGILQPINADGTSPFKLGSIVPVKFQLTDFNGNYVSTAVASIYLSKITNNILGNEIEANSTSAATTGNQFRYDSTNNQYIFNLGTKDLSSGTWQIRIALDDETSKYTNISLR